jgi:DNA-binding response OmpR family regulator
MSTRILLADDDAWLARTIGQMLERRGHAVEIVGNGRDALERAIARPPDLVITDALMPLLDGWTLVRELRARPAFATTPILILSALSSPEDRIRGLHVGADDYLAKPFRFEELDLRVGNTLRRSQSVEAQLRAGHADTTLEGKLAEVSLTSLLSFVDRERKCGRLRVRASSGELAEMMVRDGQVVQASLRDRSELDDVSCVRRAMTWRSGDFLFVACDVAVPDRVGISTTHLLLESARLTDEAGR